MPPSGSALQITPDLLLRAYASGLFPMAEGADDPDLFWLDPERRGIFPLDGLVISKSLRKAVRSGRFSIAFDRDFEAVIAACAESAEGRSSTWINATIRDLYGQLFDAGFVHTVEAYENDQLVGGLYGVAIGAAFFGESMFHRATDTSKVSLIHLAAHLIACGFTLLDTQFVTPHLITLGAVEIPRHAYHRRLADAIRRPVRFDEGPAETGEEALAILAAARAASADAS